MRYNLLRFPGGKIKAVTLSYDDGTVSDKRLLEIINKYNLKCTFNLLGNKVEGEIDLSKKYIENEILAKGHEIANHGYNHRSLSKIRPIEGIRDTIDCRKVLEETFGIIVRGMAYPDNSVNRFTEPDTYKRVKSYLEELEIAYARCAGGDNDSFALPEDWLNWMPTAHHDNPKIMEYIDKFLSLDVSKLYHPNRTLKIFYMWGHAYEFDGNNNWEHLEDICKKLSGKEDIWYATNIEIHDYVEAYKSLIQSEDGTIIYNPTLLDIWFDIDETLYCIKPGETLKVAR